MADTLSVPLTCPKCRRDATVFVMLVATGERASQTWTCPHCRELVATALPGKVSWVLARQAADPPASTPKKFRT